MPKLKTRNLFISHAWKYDEHYWKVVNCFNAESRFLWKNYSVPKHDSCKDVNKLEECLLNQMRPSSAIIILGGMYVSHSDWIDYEIDKAVEMNKIIIGVKPWGQEKIPKRLKDNADIIVGWNSSSIIKAVRDYV